MNYCVIYDSVNTMRCHFFIDKMTYLGQKFCVVVYPAEDEKPEDGCGGNGIEMKEESAPLSAADNSATPSSADR